MLLQNPPDPWEWRRLALLLSQPTEESLDALAAMCATAPWIQAGFRELTERPLEQWQGEYTRLFLNGWPRTPCPPFESAYRQGQMQGTIAGELEALYRRAGIRSLDMPPDYLGTLLEFGAWLLEREDGGPLFRELETDHLIHWVPRFGRDLEHNAQLRLYRDLGQRFNRLFSGGDHG